MSGDTIITKDLRSQAIIYGVKLERTEFKRSASHNITIWQ